MKLKIRLTHKISILRKPYNSLTCFLQEEVSVKIVTKSFGLSIHACQNVVVSRNECYYPILEPQGMQLSVLYMSVILLTCYYL
jgi:hypothetical protein